MIRHTAAHSRQEESSEYAFGDCEPSAVSPQSREAAIWADLEQLSDVLCMVRGPLDFAATITNRQQGREAMELLQRAYRAGSDLERRALLAEFGKRVYHDLIDFVEEHARELAS